MKQLINLIQNQPAKVTGAVMAIFNALLLLKLFSMTVEQMGGINVALSTVFGLFTAASVTPNVRLPDTVVKAAAEGDPPIPEIAPQP